MSFDTDLIAGAIFDLRDAVPAEQKDVLRGIDLTVVSMAAALRAEHPRFDATRFIERTGYVSPEVAFLRDLGNVPGSAVAKDEA